MRPKDSVSGQHQRPYFLLVLLLVWCWQLGYPAVTRAQIMVFSPQCAEGLEEAVQFFAKGVCYEYGLDQHPEDSEKAMEQYLYAADLGSVRALLALGNLYTQSESWDASVAGPDHPAAIGNHLYQQAIDAGCADGYYFLARSYMEGFGKPEDPLHAEQLLLQGASAGSLVSMSFYGKLLVHKGETRAAKKWLYNALDNGFGSAAQSLSELYLREKNPRASFEVLRTGAMAGDLGSLLALSNLESVSDGSVDMATGLEILPGECYLALFHSRMNSPFVVPVNNLDALCPPVFLHAESTWDY